MFDTPITMVGNVLTEPQWRRTTQTGTVLVTFRVAATSRRYVKEQGGWVDGDSLRVRVTCWRRLAENVSASVQRGDPVIVHGRLYTRDWVDDAGARHSSYELEAVSVGFDLGRGVAKFARRRAAGGTDMVEGPASDARAGGELTEEIESPERPADLPADNDLFEPFDPLLYEDPAVGGQGDGLSDRQGRVDDEEEAGEPSGALADPAVDAPESGQLSRPADDLAVTAGRGRRSRG
jgi:single-strand DNA-binding protein